MENKNLLQQSEANNNINQQQRPKEFIIKVFFHQMLYHNYVKN